MKVQKGLATWAGIVAAIGQYLGSVAVFLEADDQTVALGPLLTATATLLAVIVGRMQQAKALASRPAPAPVTWTASTGSTNFTWAPSGPTPATVPGEFDREPDTPPEAELRDLHENEQS